eukprot:4397739-Amphidinium_carterae.1
MGFVGRAFYAASGNTARKSDQSPNDLVYGSCNPHGTRIIHRDPYSLGTLPRFHISGTLTGPGLSPKWIS